MASDDPAAIAAMAIAALAIAAVAVAMALCVILSKRPPSIPVSNHLLYPAILSIPLQSSLLKIVNGGA